MDRLDVRSLQRVGLSCIAIFLAVACALPLGALASEKKGAGVADLQAPERVAALNAAWYYTWKPLPIKGVSGVEFVPMVWGGHRLDEQIRTLKKQGRVPVLLAINEPNMQKQANMSVYEVARLWPELTGLAEKISSPAAAGVLGPWFDGFYRVAKARDLKMDFMAVHLYGPPDAKKFLKKIDDTHSKYGLPIWITEFAVADWDASNGREPGSKNRYSQAEVLTFLEQVLPELERRPFVIRYAWFGAGKKAREDLRPSQLFNEDGTLTPVGQYYADFSWPPKQ
jgi:hypothetical protein